MAAVTEVPFEVVASLLNGDVSLDYRTDSLDPLRDWLSSEHRDLTVALNSVADFGCPLLSLVLLLGPEHVDKTDLVNILIGRGADVRRSTDEFDGRFPDLTPLYFCKWSGEAAALLDAGAEVDAVQSDGKTPLCHAACNNRIDVVRLLLRRGADITIAANDGRDAKSYARNGETLRLLTDVAAAGSWKSYVKEPRLALVRLRLLCARGRARPPSTDPLFQRLFGSSGSSTRSTRASKRLKPLPEEVFWHVLSFWRTSRDD
jgi:hypothetical protein